MASSLPLKNPNNICDACDFISSNKKDYTRHLLTSKHIKRSKCYENAIENASNISYITPNIVTFNCNCGKEYKHDSSYYRHKKKCSIKTHIKPHINTDCENVNEEDDYELQNNSNLILEILKQNQDFKEMILEKPLTDTNDSLIIELLKQNQEFKELMIEQNKYMVEQSKHMIELASKVGNTNYNNTTNNTKFNMQFFLNETCKDAMSITEFVDSLELTFEDLENVGRVGYAEGISQIFIKGIRATEVCKRPIHCSDIKRVVMFINDINGWEKDSNSNEKIIRLIKQIAKKNMKQASIWISQHQHIVHGHGSREQKQYSTMIGECFGGGTEEEDTKNYNKIIKRIAPEIYIDKYKD
jgi:hypothetical protein